uniref:Uncharacterized protein n=1 Tax=Anguilla anguilla TaxID=7936 RepID=A0A0E9QGR4_ANGAN
MLHHCSLYMRYSYRHNLFLYFYYFFFYNGLYFQLT